MTTQHKTTRYALKTLLFGLLLSTSASYAVLVKMPDETTLKNRLTAAGFDHFDKNTRLSEQLAGQEQEARGIAFTVDLAIDDYDKNNRRMVLIMQMRKPQIIEALLEGYPDAIQELKNYGLLK